MEKENLIINKLDFIKAELNCIKQGIMDITLTADDVNSIDEAEKEFKEGKTISHEELKRDLGL